jgi:hypothetical protein
LGENVPGKLIRESGYDKIIQEKLLSGAALGWMNMKKEHFI